MPDPDLAALAESWLVHLRAERKSLSTKLDAKVVPVLSDDELRRLVKACEGRTLRDRRDEALVRLMADVGDGAAGR